MRGRRRGRGASALVVALAVSLLHVSAATAADETEEDVDETITFTVDAGETAKTDASSTTPSTGNPIIASVVSGADGDVSFTKLSTLPEVTGYEPLAAVTITAPDATATTPHRMRITFDVSEVPTGLPLASLVLLDDGTYVPTCGTTATATPDPCFVERTVTANAMTIEVLTSTSATVTWTGARRLMERVAPSSTTDPGGIAIAASRRAFAPQAAAAVVLARVDDFADALAGGPLADARHGPLLLTSSDALDDTTLDEITRVLPTGGIVYILGGEAAVSSAVTQRLRSWGYLVTRYAGADRYATAVVVAQSGLGGPDEIVETTGANFADALAAGAVAGRIGAAVLLTNGEDQAPATAAYIRANHPVRYAIGGPSALADPSAQAFAGQDRFETAVLAARHFFSAPPFLTMSSGYSYPDAVTASASAAADGSPLILLPTSGDLPVAVQIYLRELAPSEPSAALVGSTTIVASDVEAAITSALAGA